MNVLNLLEKQKMHVTVWVSHGHETGAIASVKMTKEIVEYLGLGPKFPTHQRWNDRELILSKITGSAPHSSTIQTYDDLGNFFRVNINQKKARELYRGRMSVVEVEAVCEEYNGVTRLSFIWPDPPSVEIPKVVSDELTDQAKIDMAIALLKSIKVKA